MAETKVLTGAMLKNLLPDAMVMRGMAVGDIENYTLPGIYLLSAQSSSSEPKLSGNWNFGLMEVMDRNGDIFQRITQVDGGKVWIRVRRNGSWRPWFSLNLTQAT